MGGLPAAVSFDGAIKRAHQLSPSVYRERSGTRTEWHAVAAGSRLNLAARIGQLTDAIPK